MNTKNADRDKRNYRVLISQGAFFNAGKIMASPSVVLTYIAVGLGLPVFLVALLIPIRKLASFGVALLSADFIASIDRRITALALANAGMGVCYAVVVTAILFGGDDAAVIALLVVMIAVGSVEQYQSLVVSDVLGDVLHSQNRKRLQFSALAIGGLSALGLTWALHIATVSIDPLNRHVIVVYAAVALFVVSAFSILLFPEAGTGGRAKPAAPGSSTFKLLATQFIRNLRRLAPMSWFRRYLLIRIMTLSVELSVPFYTILAAVSHGTTHQGLTALIAAAALAFLVAGQVWGFVGSRFSNVGVICLSCILAAFSGVLLVANHFLEFANPTLVHSISLFLVTVAVQGSTVGHELLYLDLAPKEERVAGLAVSKAIQTMVAVGISFMMATLAHVQHVVWSILLLMLLAVICAIVTNLVGARPQSEMLNKIKGRHPCPVSDKM